MQSFLEEVAEDVWKKHKSFENIVFVLPSKRAGTFLQSAITRIVQKTLFAPEIFSIESFVGKLSGLSPASHTQQLFELYRVYSEFNPDEKNDFYSYSKWANSLLQDFNEIDRYLVDPKELFSNLSDIQEISHWSPEFEKTKMMEDYLAFWNNLEPIYRRFTQNLLDQGLGHQGMSYRHAYRNVKEYISSNSDKIHVFIGFNALNNAESHIIKAFLSDQKSEIYWDIDNYFLKDPVHDAGYFMRNHQKTWSELEGKQLKGISEHYLSKKNIQIIGVPKNVSQAKYAGSLLETLKTENNQGLKSTAIVLGDETLLNPLLNSIPENVKDINITMGFPLGKTASANLFLQLLNLYINKNTQGWYHRNLLDFLSHPSVQVLLTEKDTNYAKVVMEKIISENMAYVNASDFKRMAPDEEKSAFLFSEKVPSPKEFLAKCFKIIDGLRLKFELANDYIGLEHLYKFYQLFNQIQDLVQEYPFISDLKSFQSLYQELLSYETLDFKGEPLEGLQIMGMLESRNLDFDTVILTSVNEGILPAGKSNNSFIPLDIKRSFGLPTYKEKDAVYTYHFYRLLQRAKNIYLIYNTEPDVLEGSEKSRLLMQLLTDKNKLDDITETVVTPEIRTTEKRLNSISKDSNLMELIENHASTGFSPTSLTNYIRNPIDFYKRNLLKIDDVREVEETLAANTMGTIVHDTLENLYSPHIGIYLTEEILSQMKLKIHAMVKSHFENSYKGGDIGKGKNLIAFNVIVRYIENFIDLEIKDVKNHQIKILGLEESLKIQIDIDELNFPVVLKGKLDRVDERDGQIRIIDFKTGRVERNQVEITDWPDIIAEYDRSKAFQLLCYAKMFTEKQKVGDIEAGIISIKKLNEGLIRFAIKESKNSRNKNTSITQETIEQFSSQLKKLILEICNPNIPFEEKEV